MALTEQAEPDDAAAIRLLLGADRSKQGWKRRAVGTSRQAALDEVPRIGQLLCTVPIEPLRVIQRHIAARNVNQSLWLREAVVAAYLAQGGDPAVAEAAMAMRHQHTKRRDVPRDQFGQDRAREGRQH